MVVSSPSEKGCTRKKVEELNSNLCESTLNFKSCYELDANNKTKQRADQDWCVISLAFQQHGIFSLFTVCKHFSTLQLKPSWPSRKLWFKKFSWRYIAPRYTSRPITVVQLCLWLALDCLALSLRIWTTVLHNHIGKCQQVSSIGLFNWL